MSKQVITTNVEGLKELNDALIELSKLGTDKDSFAVINQVIRKSLKPVLEAAKENTNVSNRDTNKGDTPYPHLVDSIWISVPRNPKKVLKVKGRAGFGLVMVKKKGRSPTSALAKEFGLGKKRNQKPTPFLRDALYRKQGAIFNIIKSEMPKAIERRARKIYRERRK